ncbi:NAD(P)H-dependent oxidoreductase [Streptomyces ipomoeae]|uniref:NAD(P)H-dependent oxidoreductase n=1 Tax=Streptomyces ipomoeae TaxID=103232 RepID=A0AAE9B383_9ACTN|nr:NAD(P)H-dependent oxidoreductase [Streptomyces ipomoeae]TQE38986.1 NAD(P)H-dependent oxidoreductase [Streptomyces ipomoeae]
MARYRALLPRRARSLRGAARPVAQARLGRHRQRLRPAPDAVRALPLRRSGTAGRRPVHGLRHRPPAADRAAGHAPGGTAGGGRGFGRGPGGGPRAGGGPLVIAAEPCRILVLGGAAAPFSRTRSVAELVCRETAEAGSTSVLRDLAEYPLPLLHTEADGSSVLTDLRAQAEWADGMVLVTPCYHGSYSGILKNCLDHLRGDALRGKPVGVVSVGASLTAVQASEHLRAVARALGCVTAPTQAVVVDGSLTWGKDLDPETRHRITRMIVELHALAGATALLRQSAATVDALSSADHP